MVEKAGDIMLFQEVIIDSFIYTKIDWQSAAFRALFTQRQNGYSFKKSQ